MYRVYPYRRFGIRCVFKSLDFVLDLLPRRARVIPKDIRNILLIKPDHLGDVVLFTSVLKPIKEKYPNSNIDVVVGPWSNQILNHNPHIRKVYNVNHYKHNRCSENVLIKLWVFFVTYLRVLSAIRKEQYGAILNFRSYGANLVTLQYFSCSKCNIGFASSGLSPLLDIEVELKKGQHEVEYFLDILKELGVYKKLSNLTFQMFPQDGDRIFVDRVIDENKLQKFIILHPGSGDKNRMKDDGFWRDLLAKESRKIVLCGTADERDLVKNIPFSNAVDLMGVFSLLQLFEFYKRAELIYTVESLAGHIASMTNTKTVSFYSDFTDTVRWRPVGSNVEVIRDHKKYLDELV